jgi:hypothetical protein
VFFGGKPTNDRNLVITSLIVVIVLYIIAGIVVNLAVGALAKLPI